MITKRTACLFLTGMLFFGACTSKPAERPALTRLIDSLRDTGIVRSPFLNRQTAGDSLSDLYPVQSVPLEESIAPQNALLLKRRLRLEGTERNVLFAPTESEFVFTVDLTAETVLEFGVGIVHDANAQGLQKLSDPGEEGVDFRIELEIAGRTRTLFQKTLQVSETALDTRFVFVEDSIDIPYSQSAARLSLITQGVPWQFSFWTNPVLYHKNSDETNVILISVDTLRADHLGCYGYARNTSPHIDALSQDGALFLNTYASSSWTLPSHVSLLTSQHGVHHQVYHDDERMDPALLTLAEKFRAHDYTCAAFTGGGFVSQAYGFAKGFDTYDEGAGGVFHQDSAARMARAMSAWIDRNQDRKFFLFLHTYQPHSPYACPPPYQAMFLKDDSLFGHADLFKHLGGKKNLYKPLPPAERQNLIDLYDGEIRYVDDRLIGPLVSQLKSQGLYDRTLIIFTSDHGEEFFDHGAWGHGQSVYDELLKVPLILKFPFSKYLGRRVDTLVSLVDVMPTLLENMGCSSADLGLDGKSLIPILEGREIQDRFFLADIGRNVMQSHVPKKIATNRGRRKLILNGKYTEEDLAFFQYTPERVGPVELFDLASDPGERINTADQDPGLANALIRWINDFYASARKAQTRKAAIDQSVKDQLKALGYIR